VSQYLVLYLFAALIFFPIDFIWLSLATPAIYRPGIGTLLLDKPNLAIAGLFYLAYLIGLVVLVTGPAEGDIKKALIMGAVLGFVAYGTYDLTNLSTIAGFSAKVAIIDMIWGTVLTATTAAGSVWLAKLFFR
jgi:uncharacterized membrane protein